MCIGADDFVEFVLGFVVENSISVVVRVIIDPYVTYVVDNMPYFIGLFKNWIRKTIFRQNEEYLENLEDIKPKDDLNLTSTIVNSLETYGQDAVSIIIGPIFIYLIFFTRKETDFGETYGILDKVWIEFLLILNILNSSYDSRFILCPDVVISLYRTG